MRVSPRTSLESIASMARDAASAARDAARREAGPGADRTPFDPAVALILGSGLGPLAKTLDDAASVSTAELPHYPESTVEGHAGRIVFGRLRGVPVVALAGRVHGYEGYPPWRVTFPVRVLSALGARKLFITNASGSVRKEFAPGDLMLITDQIHFSFRSPLRGWNREDLAPRFVDLEEPYDRRALTLAEEAARDLGIPVRRGVLFSSLGPAYETASEVRMIRRLGGDVACMSTAPEVIVARQLGMRVFGVSCVTNHATGLSAGPLSHDEVTETADRVRSVFSRLVGEIVARWGAEP
jgi:purine-nucleoside phosphorylase